MEPGKKSDIKNSYQAPELSNHGDIEEITQGINPGTVDGDTGSERLDIVEKP